MLSEVFYLTLVATGSGLILKIAQMIFKSKCKEASFCCFRVIRDTDAEEKEAEFRILHPHSPSASLSNGESKDNMF